MSNSFLTGAAGIPQPQQFGRGVLLVLLVLMSGCASKIPINYYRLAGPDAVEAALVQTNNPTQLALALWPARLADELRRAEIVSYHGGAEVKLSARNLWAGSLQDNIDRVLHEALQRHLQQPLWRYPWESRTAPGSQLRVRIDRLGGDLAGPVVLEAQWELQGNDSVLREGRIRHTEAVQAGDYPAYVTAINRTLLAFAASLAHELNAVGSSD